MLQATATASVVVVVVVVAVVVVAGNWHTVRSTVEPYFTGEPGLMAWLATVGAAPGSTHRRRVKQSN